MEKPKTFINKLKQYHKTKGETKKSDIVDDLSMKT